MKNRTIEDILMSVDKYSNKSIGRTKAALISLFEEVVGENESTPGGLGAYQTIAQRRRNEVRAEIRERIKLL